jgi:hypothetical protein
MDGRSGEQPGATSESGPPCVKLSALLVHTFRDCDFARNRGTLFCAPHSNPIAVVTHTMCTQRWRRHTLFKNDATRVDDVRARRLRSDMRNLHRVRICACNYRPWRATTLTKGASKCGWIVHRLPKPLTCLQRLSSSSQVASSFLASCLQVSGVSNT